MDDDNKTKLSVTGEDLLNMLKELKPLLWFALVAATVVAIVWRLPDIIATLK